MKVRFLTATTAVMFLVITFAFCAGVHGKIIELFEDDAKFIDKIPNQDAPTDIKNDSTVKYRGAISLRLESQGVNNGQKYNPNVPGWSYIITQKPGADDEARWIMFVWKKDGGDGIMIQFPSSGAWGVQQNGGRYFDGVNDTGWPGIQLAKDIPEDWEVQIRDLFDDFGKFTLTGIALTQYNNVGYYDSIYLAWTEDELKKMLNEWNPVEPHDKLPTVWGDIKSR